MHESPDISDSVQESYACAEFYALGEEDLPPYAHPLSYKTIMKQQQEDADLLAAVQTDNSYVIKDFTSA